MKLGEDRMTDFLSIPLDEVWGTVEALELAEQKNDIDALKWCSRRLVWLCETSESERGDDEHFPAHIFNKEWANLLKNDPVPKSIADIIARIDQEKEPQPLTAAIAEKAIETVRTFFEDNLGGKSFKAISVSLDELKKVVKESKAA
jgi:hypothetical protein